MTQSKIGMCDQRQQQKHQLSLLLGSKDAGGSHVQKGDQPSMQNIEDTMRSNDEQLAACKKLVLAFVQLKMPEHSCKGAWSRSKCCYKSCRTLCRSAS